MIFVILFDVGICNSGWSQISFILFGIIKEQSVIKIIGFLLQNPFLYEIIKREEVKDVFWQWNGRHKRVFYFR